jgi:pyrimidine-nucleoside phosphorylase
VKVGSGALMRTEAEARALAQALADGARASGKRCVAVLSDMSQPLGDTVGNALEVAEAVRTLTPGASPVNERFRQLCLTLAAEGLALAGIASGEAAHEQAESLLVSGEALAAFRRIVAAQGGDISIVDDPAKLPAAPVILPVPAPVSGSIAAIDTAELGNIVVALGGGRARKEDSIDPAVGLVVRALVGARAEAGQPLAEVHARTEEDARNALPRVQAAYHISDTSVPSPPLILGIVS